VVASVVDGISVTTGIRRGFRHDLGFGLELGLGLDVDEQNVAA
jgi:hypothetical protein